MPEDREGVVTWEWVERGGGGTEVYFCFFGELELELSHGWRLARSVCGLEGELE